MHSALLDALAVLFPVECAGCGGPDRSVCSSCLAALSQPVVESRTPGGLLVRSAVRYEAIARRLLLALKEDNRTDVARHLRPYLTPLIDPALTLVAVPPSAAAWRRRGFDPVRLLVGRAAVTALRVVRESHVQKGLAVDERAANRAGFLRATRSLVGLRIVVADDIVTTGATLDEAARAIRDAGGLVDHAVAFAATPRYFGPAR